MGIDTLEREKIEKQENLKMELREAGLENIYTKFLEGGESGLFKKEKTFKLKKKEWEKVDAVLASDAEADQKAVLHLLTEAGLESPYIGNVRSTIKRLESQVRRSESIEDDKQPLLLQEGFSEEAGQIVDKFVEISHPKRELANYKQAPENLDRFDDELKPWGMRSGEKIYVKNMALEIAYNIAHGRQDQALLGKVLEGCETALKEQLGEDHGFGIDGESRVYKLMTKIAKTYPEQGPRILKSFIDRMRTRADERISSSNTEAYMEEQLVEQTGELIDLLKEQSKMEDIKDIEKDYTGLAKQVLERAAWGRELYDKKMDARRRREEWKELRTKRQSALGYGD